MSRKKSSSKKNISLDARYKSSIIPKLINSLMYEFCFSLSTHLRALGTAMLAKKPIIAIAISNSTIVNPFSIFFL